MVKIYAQKSQLKNLVPRVLVSLVVKEPQLIVSLSTMKPQTVRQLLRTK